MHLFLEDPVYTHKGFFTDRERAVEYDQDSGIGDSDFPDGRDSMLWSLWWNTQHGILPNIVIKFLKDVQETMHQLRKDSIGLLIKNIVYERTQEI